MERIGVAFSGGISPTDIVECVQLAEDLGYESAWVAEGHGGDQFSTLTAAGPASKRVRRHRTGHTTGRRGVVPRRNLQHRPLRPLV